MFGGVRLYFAIGLLSVFVLLSGFSYWAWQRIGSLRDELKSAKAANEKLIKNEGITNEYVQNLNDINDRHIARGMYHMSCERSAPKGANGEGGASRFGNPYPAISAYQARCERIAEKLDKLQQAVGE